MKHEQRGNSKLLDVISVNLKLATVAYFLLLALFSKALLGVFNVNQTAKDDNSNPYRE